MNKSFLITIFSTSIFLCSFGQQFPQYSMYLFDGLYINPAYAGSHDALTATAIYRDQWVKIPGAPQTASVAIHSPVNNDKIAVGLVYTYDQIGVTQSNSVNADFAYRIHVDRKKNITLSFGISAGFENYKANLGTVATTDANDPSFTGMQNRWLPNVGAGFYAYGNKFFAGIATPSILAARLNGATDFFATSTGIARQYQNLLIHGGYVFDLGKKVKFIPSMMIKYVPEYAPVTFDFNTMFVFIDRVWVGLAYRLNDSYNFSMAVNITKQIKVAYCYDLAVSPLNTFTTGTHEVMISFDAGFKQGKIVKPPRMNYF